MPLYEIHNRVTKEMGRVECDNAQDACKALGWLIGDCYVRLLREGPCRCPTAPDLGKRPERVNPRRAGGEHDEKA